MDNNQFQLAIAIVAMFQVVALAWIAYKTHTIANGLTTSKDQALIDAATKAGELKGRDFQRDVVQQAGPTPPGPAQPPSAS